MERFTFAEVVEHYLKKYRMSEKAFCYRVGISTRSLARYKADPSNLTYGTIRKMCEELNCPIEFLMEGRQQ